MFPILFSSAGILDHVLAIEELLVTDKLFLGAKSNDNFATRKKFVELTESVKENGGIVHIFSSMHVSGQQLDNYTGCAAILRFPLIQPSKEEQVETGEEDEESEAQGARRGPMQDCIRPLSCLQ